MIDLMKTNNFLKKFREKAKIKESEIDWILVKWMFKNNFSFDRIINEVRKHPLKGGVN